MILKTNIFTVKILAAVAAVVLMMPGTGRAADNGCTDERNSYIAPALALCSTHVYNIGSGQNVESAADKQYMREVVALKTTLMTQQMYKQYEYLDATIRRLKTQLEKAILTTSLQAAGAADATASGAASNKNSNIILTGADDCIAKSTKTSALDCMQSNLMLVRTAASSGNFGNAKRQLDKDIVAYTTWMTNSGGAAPASPCKNLVANRDSVNTCINTFNVALANAKQEANQTNNQMSGMRIMNMGQM